VLLRLARLRINWNLALSVLRVVEGFLVNYTASGLPLPNFLIVGAARSGTTTLYSYLQAHPEVYLPASKRPEPHFFLKDWEYGMGIDYYARKYFSAWRGQRALGEASASYLCYDWVADRILRHLPGVKLIATLRNPIERAHSNYWHTIKSGLESCSFEEAVRTERQRLAEIVDPFWRAVRPYAYVERGFYYRHLSDYLLRFPRSQMHIVLFEDLLRSPGQVLRGILEFLEVDPEFVPADLDRILNQSTPEGEKMAPSAREYLRGVFRDDILNLGQLLGRDLSSWLTEAA
jgi:hypothetical protein